MSLSCRPVDVSAVDVGRDDSGNSSSSSSSSVILSLEQMPSCELAVPTTSSSSSSIDTRLWQPDYSLHYCGYELASSDVLLPLHKTVCCALCRKKESRRKSWIDESEHAYNGHVDMSLRHSPDVSDDVSDDKKPVRYRGGRQSLTGSIQRSASSSARYSDHQLPDYIAQLQLSHKDEKLMAALIANRQRQQQQLLRGRCARDFEISPQTRQTAQRKLSLQVESPSASNAECSCTQKQSDSATTCNHKQASEERGRITSRYADELRVKQELEDERLSALRHSKQQQLAEKARANEMQLRLTLEQAKEQERQALEELRLLGDMIDASLSAAELKVKQKRQEQLARMRAELQRKIERSRQKQQELEEELRRWQESLVEYMQQQDRNVRSKMEAQLAKKREAAARQREDKERTQKENLLKMQEKEREWRANVEALIESKDARSRQIQREREAARKQARETALASKHILASRSMSLQ